MKLISCKYQNRIINFFDKNIICVGYGGLYGGYYGDGFNFAHRDLRGFIQREDILTITVDYKNNTILFHSMKANNTITKRLKDTTDCVRFVAESCYNDATIELL